MLEDFQGDSWGSIPPLRMSSLLPHDLCHGPSASLWPPTVSPNISLSAASWTARRSNQTILKEISPECSLEGLMLRLKLQYFGHPMWMKSWLIGKDPDAAKDWRQEEKGMTEDEMIGWHHQLNGHEFEQTPRDGEGQGSLVCWSPWGRKELDTTERLNSNNSFIIVFKNG